jgi:HlyD family secretion protein
VTSRSNAAALVMLLLAAGCSREPPSDTLRVSGHVEATEVEVSAEVPGRIVQLPVAEGDRVDKGALLAQLDTTDTQLQIERLKTERAGADAQLRLLQAGSRREDITQAEAQAEAADADMTAIEADLKAAELDLQRFTALLEANAGSRKQRDDAEARVNVAKERQRGARDRARAAREAVTRLRNGARREEIETARARVATVDAQMATLQQNLAYARVVSPVAGIITQKIADAGELVSPRMPLVVITDLDNAWANLFVPEPAVPRLKLGQQARVFTDAGGAAIPGKVTFISPKAEFTPRNVQTADERSKLVYRIKVAVDNREGILKPGMPVDAEIAAP